MINLINALINIFMDEYPINPLQYFKKLIFFNYFKIPPLIYPQKSFKIIFYNFFLFYSLKLLFV